MSAPKLATLYRMVMPGHTCPYGLKSLDLLNRKGYEVEDKHLASREQTDAFKKEHGIETTPQVFINGRRVGGYDDLRKFFGMSVKDKNAVTYTPVIALFAMAAAMALAASWAAFGQLWSIQAAEWFVAFAMCLLALQKLKDVDGFATTCWPSAGFGMPISTRSRRPSQASRWSRAWGCGCRFRWRCSSGPSGPCRFSRRSMSIAGNSSAPAWAGTATCRWASCP